VAKTLWSVFQKLPKIILRLNSRNARMIVRGFTNTSTEHEKRGRQKRFENQLVDAIKPEAK